MVVFLTHRDRSDDPKFPIPIVIGLDIRADRLKNRLSRSIQPIRGLPDQFSLFKAVPLDVAVGTGRLNFNIL